MNASDIRIIRVEEHYEVWIDGKFYCSADTMNEAIKEASPFM